MPYIITTQWPSHDPSGKWHYIVKSRRAVATLDEARQAVFPHALPESGGTVGPLPDGTVIEVGPASEREMLDVIGVKFAVTAHDSTSVIDAYNAAQTEEPTS